MSDDFQRRVLRVIADPTRYRIAQLTCEGPQHPKDLAKLLGMTSSAVYQHLNALLEVGFIERVEMENRVHYRARDRVPEFLRRFGEACNMLRESGDEAAPQPVEEPHPLTETVLDTSSRVEGGVLGGVRSSFLGYYVRAPFWSIVVAAICLVDIVLAVWCLVYAIFISSNPVLTIVGGLIVCGPLTALANHLYQKTKPTLPTSAGGG